jgi:hypothetical protein
MHSLGGALDAQVRPTAPWSLQATRPDAYRAERQLQMNVLRLASEWRGLTVSLVKQSKQNKHSPAIYALYQSRLYVCRQPQTSSWTVWNSEGHVVVMKVQCITTAFWA